MQISLYAKIYNDLKAKISTGIFQIGDMIPPEKELVQIYGVSRITVQKAVNLLAKDGIVERKSGVGTFVIDSDNKEIPKRFIGLILPGLTDSYGNRLLQTIISEAEKSNYQLVLKFSEESQHKESALVDELINMPVDGLLIEPVQRNFYDENLIKKIYSDFPIVILDKELDGIDSMFVGSDHYTGAFESADLIIKKGHRNVVVIGYAHIKNTTLEERIEAFTAAFWETTTPLVSKHVARIIRSTYLSTDLALLKSDVSLIKSFIDAIQPTCVICLDTHVTGLVQEALSELHLSFPDDISLFGFDSNNSSYLSTNYTYLMQDENAIGVKSVELLKKAIRNEPIENRRLLISTTLRQNGSVKDISLS